MVTRLSSQNANKVIVKRNTDPIVLIEPYINGTLPDLNIGDWTFLVKAEGEVDANALFTLTDNGIEITVTVDDELQIQFDKSHLQTPGEYVWRLDRVVNNETRTWGPHPFEIEDV